MKTIVITIDVLALLGTGLIFYGMYQINPPFAFIVVGSIILLIALISAMLFAKVRVMEKEEN